MSSSAGLNPTGRFTGLAQGYAKYRPSYPTQAIDCLIQECGLSPGSTVVDIGCGTGISTRLLADRKLHVIGIDPNDDMLSTARNTTRSENSGTIEYHIGKAEATGLPAGFAKAVTAFQAFHWFGGEEALAEFHRLLVSDGSVALMWNDRDDSDPLTAAYHDILASTREGEAIANSWRKSSDVLFHLRWFEAPRTFTFDSDQVLDEDGLIGRAMSASYAPRDPGPREKMTGELRQLFHQHQAGGVVRMRYQVSLFVARKRLVA